MTTLRQNLRALPAPAWILFGGTFVNRFGTFVLPFLVLYLTRLGFTPAQAGVALGFYGAGTIIASMLGGSMADRLGRRATIALSMFSSAAMMLALSQARAYPLILALTFFVGMTTELYRPASNALIGDIVTSEQRVTAFGMYRFAVNLGVAAGPATAGFLADHSFFYVFLGDAVTSIGYGVVALLFLPRGQRGETKEERFGDALRDIAHNRAFLLFLLATLCITPIDFQTASTFALYVTSLGFRSSTYGLLLGLNGLLIVLFELAITAWTQRRDPRRVIALGYLLAGVGFALTGLAHTLPALAATVVVWTIGEMVSSPVSGAYVTDLAPERYRGRYMGVLFLMYSLGIVLGPPLGTLAFERDPRVLWIACGALGVIGASLMLPWRSSKR